MTRRGVALAALALVSCAGSVPRIGEPAPALRESADDRFSDYKELYDGLDTRLFAGATYQSPSFVAARVRRLGVFQGDTAQGIEAKLNEEQAKLAPYHAFFLGVHVNTPRYDDFDKKSSVWRLALVTPEGQVEPVEVSRIGRSDLQMRSLYPYMGDFWVGYWVRFPKQRPDGTPTVVDGTRRFALRLASVLGQADLTVAVE